MKTLAIAMICHSINAAYCQSLGDDSQVAWDDTPETHKQSLIAGVEMHLANPQATPEQSHESWYQQKETEGWTYGEFKDLEKKEHPCFLPYEELPLEQKAKDYLFRTTVHLMKDLPDVEEYLALADEVKNLREKVQTTAVISPVAIPTAKPLGASGIAIQYVGRKDQHIDRLYGSNLVFAQGQVRIVPSNIASNLLKHPEFQRYEQQDLNASDSDTQQSDDTSLILDESKKKQEKDDENEALIMDEIDTVQRITDKKSLVEYAKHKYDQSLKMNSSVKTLQDQVVDLIKRFGVV
ncbi:RyR domain-containing protein [Acinetobacter bereziniae]|uniref:RyR domain-containing protein n=1 Tax=Acinetobacter bereziniae TaxID=106648 RepID=UPI002412E456|nr:RyR domain-containing protein [Acinetobacter bereziniae]MDG3555642.1 RyR domain-containing protein [Acinetobacter bereziniae]